MKQAAGSYFDVQIYDDHVLKYPKKECVWARLEWIAKTQTRLAETIPGIMSAICHGDHIEMRIPPGIHCREIPKRRFRREIKPKVDEVVRQVNEHGYELKDTGRCNVYYDHASDQVWIIDYSHLT